MPVRSRSRASSSTRNAPQSVVDRAQLVELGVEAGGDHAAVAHLRRGLGRDGAREQRVPLRRRRRAPARASRTSGASRSASAARSAGSAASVSRKPGEIARARGAQARCAPRCARRRRCGAGASRERRGTPRRREQVRRSRRAARQRASRRRSGCVSQWRSSRLPAAVAHASSSDSSVGAGSPLSVAVISRLRRVAGSSARYSPGRSTASVAHVRERGLLRRARVATQRAGGAKRERHVVGAERGEVQRAELACQRLVASG